MGGIVAWHEHMAYDLAGRRTSLSLPDGFTTTYTYDLTGGLTQILQGGSPYATYAYDNLGRRAGITRPNAVNTTYGYDPVSRLTSLAHSFPNPANNLTLTYSHNPAGQITGETRSNLAYSNPAPGASTTGYGVNGLNQTGIGSVYTHDAKGNMLGDGTHVYTYDQANRLRSSTVGSTVATLTYDGLGRLGELVGTQGARYVYDGLEISGVTGVGGTSLINRIVRGPQPDEAVVVYPTASTPLWLIQDHLGSTIGITDPSGGLVSSLAYDEYGQPRPGNSGRFQYTGQLWLPDFGAYHYKARAYSPGLGRFLQTDPIGYAAGMNIYSYVGNDPVNLRDPLGLQENEGERWECRLGMNCNPTTTLGDVVVTPSGCSYRATFCLSSDDIEYMDVGLSGEIVVIGGGELLVGYTYVIDTSRRPYREVGRCSLFQFTGAAGLSTGAGPTMSMGRGAPPERRRNGIAEFSFLFVSLGWEFGDGRGGPAQSISANVFDSATFRFRFREALGLRFGGQTTRRSNCRPRGSY